MPETMFEAFKFSPPNCAMRRFIIQCVIHDLWSYDFNPNSRWESDLEVDYFASIPGFTSELVAGLSKLVKTKDLPKNGIMKSFLVGRGGRFFDVERAKIWSLK